MVWSVFERITISGGAIASAEPQSDVKPLFAAATAQQRSRPESAEADAHAMAVGCVVSSMRTDGALALRYLGRRFPKDWGEKVAHEMSGPDAGPIEVDVRTRVRERLERLSSRISSRVIQGAA